MDPTGGCIAAAAPLKGSAFLDSSHWDMKVSTRVRAAATAASKLAVQSPRISMLTTVKPASVSMDGHPPRRRAVTAAPGLGRHAASRADACDMPGGGGSHVGGLQTPPGAALVPPL
jgi:hypothetical protein